MTTTTKKTTTKPKVVKAKTPLISNLPNNPFAYEVLDVTSKQRSKAKKIEVLQKYKHPSLVTLFVWNFDSSIITLLPEGDVPYGNTKEDQNSTGTLSGKINDAVGKMAEMGSTSLGSQDQGKASIRNEYKKFYNFCKGGNPTLSNLRRETMFINVLEGLHPLEAELLILVKDKKLESKYKISKEVVSIAFPEIIWGDRS
tara:strand:+ start:25 stop:621 length:597 start_codon:yes stop_codon:yes gene_type:complete